jgi:uncharacterized membrane protein YfcA
MEFAGYTAALLMGILLGLIGGGGSILTVPILVYLFGTNPTLSTAYSLFIVGITALIGSISHFRKGNVNLKMALFFGLPSMIAVFLVRRFVVTAIPDQIATMGNIEITRDNFILTLFAILMLAAAWTMIKPSITLNKSSDEKQIRLGWIVFEGVVVGGLTGLVGAGGGFLIIPALVLFTGIQMKEAIGTSLVIIAVKSLFGFLGDASATSGIDYSFLMTFSTFAIGGIIIGSNLIRFIDNQKLKPAFGWFVLFSGILVLIKEWIMK